MSQRPVLPGDAADPSGSRRAERTAAQDDSEPDTPGLTSTALWAGQCDRRITGPEFRSTRRAERPAPERTSDPGSGHFESPGCSRGSTPRTATDAARKVV